MADLKRLDLKSSDGRPLVHKYYQHLEPAKGLLVMLPGNHYGVDGPLLYYPSDLLCNRGWDTLAITYGFQSRGEDFSAGIIAEILLECETALCTCLKEKEYGLIGLIGKSLGALIIAQLCNSVDELASAKAVYLTPPINTPFFGQLFLQTSQPAHIGIGTGDRFFTKEVLEKLQSEREFGLTLIENADHSMNIDGDIEATFGGMKRLVREVVEFLDG